MGQLLFAVAQSIAVGVLLQRVGAVGQLLLAVIEAIAVAVRVQRVGAQVGLVAVAQPVPVRVGQGTVAVVRIQEVGHPVPVQIAVALRRVGGAVPVAVLVLEVGDAVPVDVLGPLQLVEEAVRVAVRVVRVDHSIAVAVGAALRRVGNAVVVRVLVQVVGHSVGVEVTVALIGVREVVAVAVQVQVVGDAVPVQVEVRLAVAVHIGAGLVLVGDPVAVVVGIDLVALAIAVAVREGAVVDHTVAVVVQVVADLGSGRIDRCVAVVAVERVVRHADRVAEAGPGDRGRSRVPPTVPVVVVPAGDRVDPVAVLVDAIVGHVDRRRVDRRVEVVAVPLVGGPAVAVDVDAAFVHVAVAVVVVPVARFVGVGRDGGVGVVAVVAAAGHVGEQVPVHIAVGAQGGQGRDVGAAGGHRVGLEDHEELEDLHRPRRDHQLCVPDVHRHVADGAPLVPDRGGGVGVERRVAGLLHDLAGAEAEGPARGRPRRLDPVEDAVTVQVEGIVDRAQRVVRRVDVDVRIDRVHEAQVGDVGDAGVLDDHPHLHHRVARLPALLERQLQHQRLDGVQGHQLGGRGQVGLGGVPPVLGGDHLGAVGAGMQRCAGVDVAQRQVVPGVAGAGQVDEGVGDVGPGLETEPTRVPVAVVGVADADVVALEGLGGVGGQGDEQEAQGERGEGQPGVRAQCLVLRGDGHDLQGSCRSPEDGKEKLTDSASRGLLSTCGDVVVLTHEDGPLRRGWGAGGTRASVGRCGPRRQGGGTEAAGGGGVDRRGSVRGTRSAVQGSR